MCQIRFTRNVYQFFLSEHQKWGDRVNLVIEGGRGVSHMHCAVDITGPCSDWSGLGSDNRDILVSGSHSCVTWNFQIAQLSGWTPHVSPSWTSPQNRLSWKKHESVHEYPEVKYRKRMHQNMAQVSREIVKVRSEIANVWILQFGAVRGSTSGRKGKPVGEMGLNGCYKVAPPSLEFCHQVAPPS